MNNESNGDIDSVPDLLPAGQESEVEEDMPWLESAPEINEVN